MRYSKWLPDRGGYAYYDSSERKGLGDDLPIPRLRATSNIGVASTDIGRPLPLGAKLAGHGQLAQGSVVPLDRSGLSGALDTVSASPMKLALIAAASAVIGVFVSRKFIR